MNDRIVPVSNSRNLVRWLNDAQMSPRSGSSGGGSGGGGGGSSPERERATLIELRNCGHCPQEETAEQTSALISDFLEREGLLEEELEGKRRTSTSSE